MPTSINSWIVHDTRPASRKIPVPWGSAPGPGTSSRSSHAVRSQKGSQHTLFGPLHANCSLHLTFYAYCLCLTLGSSPLSRADLLRKKGGVMPGAPRFFPWEMCITAIFTLEFTLRLYACDSACPKSCLFMQSSTTMHEEMYDIGKPVSRKPTTHVVQDCTYLWYEAPHRRARS